MSPHRKPERQQGSASLKGEGRLAARAMIVKAVGQKYGVRRSWRELEFTQLALQSLYPDAPPMGEPRKNSSEK